MTSARAGRAALPATLRVLAAKARARSMRVARHAGHTPDQIARACALPVDYIAVGPVFGTHTKETGYAPVGLSLVSEAQRQADGADARPVVAIGGITLDTAPAVMDAGASAVVVISDLLRGGDPGARVRAYLSALGEMPSRV